MFRSTRTRRVVTQHDHAIFAGQLAANWGNERFARPELDFDQFVQGVSVHDAQYDEHDNDSLTEMPRERWFEIMRRTPQLRFDSPIVEAIVKLHIRRLLEGRQSSTANAIVADLNPAIQNAVSASDIPLRAFRFADQITNFCDLIAFYFPLGEPAEFDFPFAAQTENAEPTLIHVQISQANQIIISPWPFSIPAWSGVIPAYQAEHYPSQLVRTCLPYHVIPAQNDQHERPTS